MDNWLQKKEEYNNNGCYLRDLDHVHLLIPAILTNVRVHYRLLLCAAAAVDVVTNVVTVGDYAADCHHLFP